MTRAAGGGGRPKSLTPMEVQLLQKVAEGRTNADIAKALGISQHTVKTHLGRVYIKLNVRGRAHAVTEAIRSGQLPAFDPNPLVWPALPPVDPEAAAENAAPTPQEG